MVHRDYKVLSIDECRQIIGVCKEQKRKMEHCESKGVHISGLSNRNMDFWINKFEDLCRKKRDWEREQRERERDRQQRERDKKQRIACEVQEIYEGLKRYTEERVSVQERQRRHWSEVRHGVSRIGELDEDRGEIGRINNEINKLIGRLTRYPKQYSCYKLAMDHLEREIKRCEKIRDYRSEHIRKVARGEATWITPSGKKHMDNTDQIKYVAQLEDKIKRYKKQLSKLRELNRQ